MELGADEIESALNGLIWMFMSLIIAPWHKHIAVIATTTLSLGSVNLFSVSSIDLIVS